MGNSAVPVKDLSLNSFKRMLLDPSVLKDPVDPRDFKLRFKSNVPLIEIDYGDRAGLFKLMPTAVPDLNEQKRQVRFDLRKKMPRIEHQGQMPWCTAYSLSALIDYFVYMELVKHLDFSEEWLYEEARELAGLADSGRDGLHVHAGLKLLQKRGCLPEREFSQLTHEPKKDDKKLQEILVNYKISAYAAVHPRSIDNVKQAILTYGPLPIATYVYENWRWVGRDGKIEMPQPGERPIGAHATLIVGWHDELQAFLIRNSWGRDWGVRGYGWLPYEFFRRKCFSCWSAVDAKGTKDLYKKTCVEQWYENWPEWLKDMFGSPF
ncbi:MAG: hypothetical protein GF365_02995 [Candidatus Buchananbacteria bacterium]|nr:hypothetical protein [Candidatus Buchananbacteria bacterium]